MRTTLLKYGNTNTYLVGPLLIDTDMAGTLPLFWRELKRQGAKPEQIAYVLATHYHPDHMGLIGELTQGGAKLLLMEHQLPFVHASDAIFTRMKSASFVPVDERRAAVLSCGDSRAFLAGIGIAGEIVPTASHSPDGAALVLDDGRAFVGDLEPREYLGGYDENEALRADWDRLLRLGAGIIHYGHSNVQELTERREER